MVGSTEVLKARILIVDDQPANITLLERVLHGAGYASISSTRNPQAVCELHRKERYDLILLDVMMPGMDGFQVMESLKTIETDGYLPVLVITAEPDHKLRALKAGAKDFITKPFDVAEIRLRVYNMLEVRLLHLESKKLNSQLQSANQELEAFSHSVSHDLRAPLRHVMGFVEILKEEMGPSVSEICSRHLATISHAVKRMELLIDNLLTFSRAGRAQFQKTDVDLDKLVKDLVGEFREETAGRNIAWEIQPLPCVQADRALLRMALANLLSNAVKFTGAHSAAKIEIGSIPSGNGECEIFIRDDGAGFDMAYAGKLFGAFQRLHATSEFPGTGIGLATVQRIVHRHGGRAWGEGVVEGGATFHFTL